MSRFIQVEISDDRVPEMERGESDDYRMCILDTEQGNRVVGTDGGEPEDQTLYRNWSWVLMELNRVAEEGKVEDAEPILPPDSGNIVLWDGFSHPGNDD